MAQRIKGQETTLTFTTPNGDIELADILDWEAELDLTILEEKYIGQTANAYDDIYNGVGGTCNFHMQNEVYLAFTELVQDRAERRTPASGVFSATVSMQFPSGVRARLTFENIFFGPMPLKVADRSSYVSGALTWKCERLRRVL